MAMLITTVDAVRKAASSKGWLLFCAEYDIDPDNPQEPDHGQGVCIDKYDLARFGMETEFVDLVSSVRTFMADSLSGSVEQTDEPERPFPF